MLLLGFLKLLATALFGIATAIFGVIAVVASTIWLCWPLVLIAGILFFIGYRKGKRKGREALEEDSDDDEDE